MDLNKLDGIYRGVIEDNSSDPEKMGRCKIRVFGVHSPNKIQEGMDGIPTDELPWAEPVMGLFEGSISGFGSWTIPLQGSHVFLFFEGGNPIQPRYFATVPGKPTDRNHGFTKKQGFSDPDDIFPVDHKLKESDFHRLSRGISDQTIIMHKEENLDKNVKTASGDEWDEPQSGYLTTSNKYPNNCVFATRSGIVIELDNNSDNSRIHIYHPSNSYCEFKNNGDLVISNSGDRYDITKTNSKVHVKSDKDITIDGVYNKRIDDSEVVYIENDKTVSIGADKNITVGGETNETSSSSHTIIASTINLNP